MPTRSLLILNPRSRGGATGRRAREVADKLRAALGPLELEVTRGPRDAERIAREAARAGVETLLVAGGDGTVNEVVSGLLDAGLGAHTELGLLPLGTGGDLLRTLGLPRELDAAIERIARGKHRTIDAGRVEYRTPEGRRAASHFLNVASVGLSGLVTELVNRSPKQLGPRVAYTWGTLRAIARWRAPRVRLDVDGRRVHDAALTFATAANGRYFGGGMQVAPAAVIDDGLLDVVIVPGLSRARLVARLPQIYAGTHVEDPAVSHFRARCLEADSAATVWVEIDGEPLGRLPARFEVLPGAVRVLGAGT